MSEPAAVESAQEFAHSAVPTEATGSALKVFFIVSGACFGLSVFILASLVVSGLGLREALLAFGVGAGISGVLGGVSVYVGARMRMSVALLAQRTFGFWGGQAVRVLLAISLIGWFAVITSLFGATTTELVQKIFSVHVGSAWVSVPLTGLITLVVLKGVLGLERLGQVVVPCAVVMLVAAVVMTLRRAELAVPLAGGSGALTFGDAVSAIVGSYIVGIVIQPDYGRFVRRPRRAALATFVALGAVYPLSLLMSALPMALLREGDVILAMVSLGIGLPALLVFLLAAWMDASASLYSGCLSLATLFPKLRFRIVVVAAGCLGALLAVLHAEQFFMSFLQVLSISLPPVAAVQCYVVLVPLRKAGSDPLASPGLAWVAVAAWIVGAAVGIASSRALFRLTDIPALDSIVGALAVMICLRPLAAYALRMKSPLGGSRTPSRSEPPP